MDISGHDIRMSVMGLREYMSVMGVERIYVSDGGLREYMSVMGVERIYVSDGGRENICQ